MKLYAFGAGILKSKKEYFTAGSGVGEDFDVPVPFFLIDHPDGYVLFDTGNALECVNNKEEHWGAIIAAYDVHMKEEEFCANAIQSVGVMPKDIKYVIQSHLHLDHAGGTGCFPNAQYIVQREELNYAFNPDFYMKGAYIKADITKDVDWLILEGPKDDMYDVFGDGKIQIMFTPGHTPGHQSVIVNLEEEGTMVLAADACYTAENLDTDCLPGLSANNMDVVKSVQRFRNYQAKGAKIVTGHDPDGWEAMKKAPKFYK